MKAFVFNNSVKDDCNELYEFLTDIGTLNIDKGTLFSFYKMYCMSYNKEGYVKPDNPDTLYAFAEWLSEKEI